MKFWTKYAAGVVMAGLVGTIGAAEPEQEKRNRRGPPPVAIDACAAAVDGDTCSFEGRHGEMLSGVCMVGREEVLACRPEARPNRPQR